MVTLKKRVISGKTYYYLGHTYREKGKIKYKETYIGSKLPDNIDLIKKNFLLDVYKEKWFNEFEKIKKAYSEEQKTLPDEIKEKELERFAIAFTYDTNRIEGSKLSFKDTSELLELGITPKNKPLKDIKEAEAHRDVFYRMLAFKGEISLKVILEWHSGLFETTKPGIAGQVRTYQVCISNSKHIPPTPVELRNRIPEFFRWYSAEKEKMNPVELSGRAHVKFETMHPFGDGNGRIGRLIMNFILHKNSYPMLNIKYTGRRSYYNALERSNAKGDENIFVQWFFRKYLKENSRYLS
jgi:Fic family protein